AESLIMNGIWSKLRGAADNWLDHRTMRMSAAVALYSILSLSSLVVCAIAITGLVFGEQAATGALTHQLRLVFGQAGGEMAQMAIAGANHPQQGVIATVIG